MVLYVVAVIPLTVVYLTVPRWHIVTWAAIGLGGVAAIVTGIRANRPAHAWPWYCLAAANLAFTAGDTTYNILNRVFHEQNPFPSLADVFYLVTYPLFAIGLLGFIRYRATGRDRGTLLDAMILTTGLALLSWTWLINPQTTAPGTSWTQKAISIAYPLGDILLLAMLVRLLTPSSVRSPAIQFLTAGTLGILVSDVLYGLLQLKGTWRVGTPMDLGWVVFFTAWGLSALHPSMVRLTARAPARPPGIHRPLLAVLAAVSLVAPGLLLYEAVRGEVRDALVIAVFSAVLFLLVMSRLSGLVAVHLKDLDGERGLQAAAASLVSAASLRDIAESVEHAGPALFGSAMPHESVLLTGGLDDEGLTACGTGARPWRWRITPADPSAGAWLPALSAHRSQVVRIADLGPAPVAALAGPPAALLCPLAVHGRPRGAGLAGVLVVTGTEQELAERWSACETLASQVALAVQRVELGREISRRKSEAYFRTLVHNTSDVILILDDDDHVRYASPSAEGMFDRGRLTGTALGECLAARDRTRALRALARTRADGSSDSRDDWQVVRPGGTRIDVEVRCSNLRHDPTVRGLVLTLRDVTEQRQLERELTRRAFHDSLTGLPNRMLLLERVERALLRGGRDGTVTCVLFVDLDDFKVVNDTRGHAAGDELLVSVSRRLTATLRASDAAARLGGDEFAVLMEGVKDPEEAEMLAAQLVRRLSQPFRVSGGTLTVSASVGVATSRDSATGDELVGHSDLALYAAKTAGKRQWRRYREDLHTGILERHELQSSLEHAITAEALRLHYQPIVEIAGGDVVGFEALARWPDGNRDPVPPEQFITLAEETGHILSLGTWALRNAASHGARWQRVLPRPDPLKVSVNVSARQLRDPGFLDVVRGVLGSSGLAPGSLVLELTETVPMHRDRQIRTAMGTLKDLGVKLAIDDFGTGFSSLSYLREFPIDILKIDKSFIDDITVDQQQAALVDGIVRIADTLGLQVIAEGIEQTLQRDRLAAMGCRYGQGYLFARPMPADVEERFLRAVRDGGPPGPQGPAARPGPKRRRSACAPRNRTATGNGPSRSGDSSPG
jgi:diguanylate cyclase (GGDEF)-like protein/PAS domain S-box-containing protein